MNVYDFDHTIYAGDCTIDFWCYCLKKYPIILRTIPSVLLYYILFKLHLCQRETFKEQFYTFLKYVPDGIHPKRLAWKAYTIPLILKELGIK